MKNALRLSLLALTLASCAGQPGPPAGPDPLTFGFVGRGTLGTGRPAAPVTLTDTFNGVTQNIGTLGSDGSVNINISAEMARAFGLADLSTFKNQTFGVNCNIDQLSVNGAGQYYVFGGAEFSTSAGRKTIDPVTIMLNADGSSTESRRLYLYSTQAATISGTVTCSDGSGIYDLRIKPGWNQITATHTFAANNDVSEEVRYQVVDQTNTYNNSWYFRPG